MQNLDYDLNMPVHLARREMFFDQALKILNAQISLSDLDALTLNVVVALYFLKSAGEHAHLLLKRDNPESNDEAGIVFLRNMRNELLALLILLNSRISLEKRHDLVEPFFGGATASDLAHEKQLHTMILLLWEKLQFLAKPTADALLASKKAAIKAMTRGDKERYLRAANGLKKHLQLKLKNPDVIRDQIFSSIREMKYE